MVGCVLVVLETVHVVLGCGKVAQKASAAARDTAVIEIAVVSLDSIVRVHPNSVSCGTDSDVGY